MPSTGASRLWLPLAAQGLVLSWLLWLVQRGLGGVDRGAASAALCRAGGGDRGALVRRAAAAGLAGAGPGAGVCPAGLRRDGLAGRSARGLALLALLACAAHLSHLPIAAALVLLVLAVRRSWRPALRCALPLAGAMVLLLATNAWAHGRWALSPYGAVFALARLVADGPAARTIEARCPGGRLASLPLGRAAADRQRRLPLVRRRPGLGERGRWRAAGRADLPGAGSRPRSWPRRCGGSRWACCGPRRANTLRQLGMARVGDTLGPENLQASVGRQLARWASRRPSRPASPPRCRRAGCCGRLAAPFLVLHPAVLLLGARGDAARPGGGRPGMRGRSGWCSACWSGSPPMRRRPGRCPGRMTATRRGSPGCCRWPALLAGPGRVPRADRDALRRLGDYRVLGGTCRNCGEPPELRLGIAERGGWHG